MAAQQRVPVKLRHDLAGLWPSQIASQWYCEIKTHLAHTHPDAMLADARATAEGDAGHDALAAVGVPIEDEDVRQALATGEPMRVFEMGLEAKFDGVSIRGRADMVDVAANAARMVYEFKFSRSTGVWPSYHAQLSTYGLMLHALGIDTAALVTAAVVFPRHPEDDTRADALARLAAGGVLGEVERLSHMGRDEILAHGLEALTLRRQDYRIGLRRFDRTRASADMRWALQYWRGERAPVATDASVGKCRACPANAARLCGEALAPPREERGRASSGVP